MNTLNCLRGTMEGTPMNKVLTETYIAAYILLVVVTSFFLSTRWQRKLEDRLYKQME